MAQIPFLGAETSVNDTPFLGSPADTLNLDPVELKIRKGIANGYAPLDGNAKVPVANLPDTASLDAEVDGKITTHNSATTSVHGIPNTADLATKTYADGANSTHNSATTSVHGITDTANLVLTNDSRISGIASESIKTSNANQINLGVYGGSITSDNYGGSISTIGYGGSINLNGYGGSLDLSNHGGSITTGPYGGSINTSNGGSINTSNGGGSINTSGGVPFPYPEEISSGDGSGASGGSIDLRGGNGGGDGSSGVGGSIQMKGGSGDDGNGGAGGSILMNGATRDGHSGSINLSATPNASGGSINLSAGASGPYYAGAGGSITSIGSAGTDPGTGQPPAIYAGGSLIMSAGASGAGGSINTSNGGGSINTTGIDGGVGGSINTSGGVNNGDPFSGGSINTSAGGSINTSNEGGSINTSGNSGGDAGGSINTSAGQEGSGGSINTSNNGGSITTTGGYYGSGGSINTSCGTGDGSAGGSINTSGGTGDGSAGGSINTSNRGGSILTSGNADANYSSNGGSIDLRALMSETSNGGSIISTGNFGYNGGTLNMSAGQVNNGGSIDTRGGAAGAGGSINLSNYGGSINLTGGFSGIGGSINLSGGGSINTSDGGGSINTSGEGGSINTKGVGSIELGHIQTRTTLNGSASGGNKTITLPNETGTVALTNDSRFTDARTPTSHTHGNFSNDGKVIVPYGGIVSASAVDAFGGAGTYPMIQGSGVGGSIQVASNGVITIASAGTGYVDGQAIRAGGSRYNLVTQATRSNTSANLPVITTTGGGITIGSFGTTANSFCQGNDVRLGSQTIFTLGGEEKTSFALSTSYYYGGQLTKSSRLLTPAFDGGNPTLGLRILGNWTIKAIAIHENLASSAGAGGLSSATRTYKLVNLQFGPTITDLVTNMSMPSGALFNVYTLENQFVNISGGANLALVLTTGSSGNLPLNTGTTTITADIYCVPR